MIESLDLPALPEGWVWTEVEDIGNIVTGTTPSKSKKEYYGNDFPFFKPTDLNNGYYIRKSDDGLSKTGIEKTRLLPAKSILVTCIGATIGKTGFIRTEGASNQQINAIIPEEHILPEFIYFMCISPQFQKSIIDNASATTSPILNKSKFMILPLPLPPFPEQHRIVAKIEELFTKQDAGVKSLEKTKAQLKRYRQAVLKHAFEGKLTEEWRERHKDELEPASVLLERIKEERKKYTKGKYKELPQRDTSDLPELPEGWMWTRVGEIGQVSGGKRLPKGHKYATESTDNPYIRVTDFHNMAVKVDGLQYLNPDTHELIRKYTISKDDVYISIAGTIGRVGTIPRELDGANLTENGAKITNLSCYNNRALSYVLNSTFCQEQIARLTIHTNQPKLALFRIEQIIVPLPPLAEQHKIVEETERRFSVADDVETTVNQSLKQAERLRQSILKTAFEGKLVPQYPTDESASVLLEKINGEKTRCEAENMAQKKKPKRVPPQQLELF